MKKSANARKSTANQRLTFSPETIRVLTERELTLVAAGNCLNASGYSQTSSSDRNGTC